MENKFNPLAKGRKIGEISGNIICIPHRLSLILDRWSKSRTDVEIAGFLIGRVFHNKNQVFSWIDGFIEAKEAKYHSAHIVFTCNTWRFFEADLEEYQEKKNERAECLGWVHTHPGYSAFFSSRDRVMHSQIFNSSHHFGLVIDPLNYEAAIFQREFSGKIEKNGFYITRLIKGVKVPWNLVGTA